MLVFVGVGEDIIVPWFMSVIRQSARRSRLRTNKLLDASNSLNGKVGVPSVLLVDLSQQLAEGGLSIIGILDSRNLQ